VVGRAASGVILAAVTLAGAALLRYTRLGRNAYALGSNPQAAFLSGISVIKTTVGLYILSGALVGLAGIILLGGSAPAIRTRGSDSSSRPSPPSSSAARR